MTTTGARTAPAARTAGGRSRLRVPMPRVTLAWLDVALLLLGFALLVLLPNAPAVPHWRPRMLFWHDGFERYVLLDRWDHGDVRSLRADHNATWLLRWPWLASLPAMPVWLLGRVVLTPSWWLARFNLLALGVAMLVVWRCLRDRVEPTVLRTFFLLLIAASMFPAHLAAYFPIEPLPALLLGCGVLVACTRAPKTGWTAAALGTAMIPALLPAFAVGIGLVAVRQRRIRLLAFPVLSALLLIGDVWFRSGRVALLYATTDLGYRTVLPYSGKPGFSYPVLFGLLNLLFSPGRGLIFFAPGLFLPARAALRRAGRELWSGHAVLLVVVAVATVVYAAWWGWDGGFFFGPRFLLIASIPASLALAAWLWRPPTSVLGRVGLLAVLLLSSWVAVAGAVFGMSGLQRCDVGRDTMPYLCDSVPEFSALWHPFVAHPPLDSVQLAFAGFVAVVFGRLAGPLVLPLARQGWSSAASALPRLRSGWRW
ncbi:MAG TPA: hypothetical protein VLR26_01875 [Frankiaceae bacterium]|nr:hypothetical protein [Frankiaceae bacterium]